jgi:hypothetical protein
LYGLIFFNLFLDSLLYLGRHTNPPPKRSMAAGSRDVPDTATAKDTTHKRPNPLFIIPFPLEIILSLIYNWLSY